MATTSPIPISPVAGTAPADFFRALIDLPIGELRSVQKMYGVEWIKLSTDPKKYIPKAFHNLDSFEGLTIKTLKVGLKTLKMALSPNMIKRSLDREELKTRPASS